MGPKPFRTAEVPTLVKNPELVFQRRRQIIDAAVRLFIRQGFHKTTTRQIARAAGVSTGGLYEYVRTKEDILYLVCNAIHREMELGVSDALARAKAGTEALAGVMREYLLVCHRMSDHILFIYQETQSLPAHWRKIVLENDVHITGLFIQTLSRLAASGGMPALADPRRLELTAHTITVVGHMWAFRRWFLARHYTIEDYIRLQTEAVLGMAVSQPPAAKS
jgi:AcrR family transcriptional regulator